MLRDTARYVLLLSMSSLLGCPQSTTTTTARDEKTEPSKAANAPTPPASPSRVPAASPDEPSEPKRGRFVEGAPLELQGLLGKSPQEAEARVGEPTGKGMMRKSCVRFVPDRVFFECDYAWQSYPDETGTYEAIQVGYEDGRVASVAVEGVPGEGSFDPEAALAKVGLELPGEPTVSEPAKNTKLWSWFNDKARLLVDGKQYRVEVSSVGDAWSTSKVEVILNHPLTAEQKAKLKAPKNDG